MGNTREYFAIAAGLGHRCPGADRDGFGYGRHDYRYRRGRPNCGARSDSDDPELSGPLNLVHRLRLSA